MTVHRATVPVPVTSATNAALVQTAVIAAVDSS
jgi:hypothetical protein